MPRVLIVDDHPLVRKGVRQALDEHSSLTAECGEATNAAEALALLQDREWDVVILDLSLAGGSGLDLLREIKQRHPAVPVLVLSMHAGQQYAHHARKAGAAGYVTKGGPSAVLVDAIVLLLRGEPPATA